MRRVKLHEGVKVSISTNVKDELILEGESLDNVSQSAASIQQICNVRNKEYAPVPFPPFGFCFSVLGGPFPVSFVLHLFRLSLFWQRCSPS